MSQESLTFASNEQCVLQDKEVHVTGHTGTLLLSFVIVRRKVGGRAECFRIGHR